MTRLIISFMLSVLIMAVVQFVFTATAIKYPWAPLAAGVMSCILIYAAFERTEKPR